MNRVFNNGLQNGVEGIEKLMRNKLKILNHFVLA